MLVSDQFRKCTVFVAVQQGQGPGVDPSPAATAFLVSVPIAAGEAATYAVTARHVVDSARFFGALHLRFNLESGGWTDLRTDPDAWLASPESDVAVVRIAPPPASDMRTLPLDRIATRQHVQENEIGEGDELFFVGLFSPRPGVERAQPIVRFGTIALMPREPIAVRMDPGSDSTTRIEAYLVEARSWGGVSGSPAFIYFSPTRQEGFLTLSEYGTSHIVLLGLVQGHFELEAEVAFLGDVGASAKVSQNAGLAAVVPSWAIIKLLLEAVASDERGMSGG